MATVNVWGGSYETDVQVHVTPTNPSDTLKIDVKHFPRESVGVERFQLGTSFIATNVDGDLVHTIRFRLSADTKEELRALVAEWLVALTPPEPVVVGGSVGAVEGAA